MATKALSFCLGRASPILELWRFLEEVFCDFGHAEPYVMALVVVPIFEGYSMLARNTRSVVLMSIFQDLRVDLDRLFERHFHLYPPLGLWSHDATKEYIEQYLAHNQSVPKWREAHCGAGKGSGPERAPIWAADRRVCRRN
jgi:hypothetical protein